VALENEFPVGEPEIFIGPSLDKLEVTGEACVDKETNTPMVGLLQVSVIPPASLYLPILGVIRDSKLLFGLCNKCMEEKTGKLCCHGDAERELTSVWTTHEVCAAIAAGYKVRKIHEAFVYRKQRAIFKSFYAHLAHMKLSSEPPEDWEQRDEASKQAFLDELNSQADYLHLRVQDMRRNPQRRAFAKLLQNSQFGICS